MEEWRVIPEHPRYRVSNIGNVEIFRRGYWCHLKPHLIYKGQNQRPRYWGFFASGDERRPNGALKKKIYKVHQIVARLFIGPRPDGLLVLHLNDKREDNRVVNLMYGTSKQNTAHAIANGKHYMGGPIKAANRPAWVANVLNKRLEAAAALKAKQEDARAAAVVKIPQMLARYDAASKAKVGSVIPCVYCQKQIVKSTYHNRFCTSEKPTKGQSSCKDLYWNYVEPRGKPAISEDCLLPQPR